MARVLVVTSPERGHVNPLVGVVQRLAEAGHHVAWAGLPCLSDQIRELPVEPVEVSVPEAARLATSGRELATVLRDPERLRAWIRGLLIEGAKTHLGPMRAAIRELDPDVVAPDPMLYGAIVAAHLERRPWVALSSSLNPVTPADFDCALTRTVRGLADERSRWFAEFGLEPRFSVCDAISPWMTGVFAAPEYATALGGELAEGVTALGPSLADAGRGDGGEAVPGDGLVYVSFGSQAWFQPARFAKLLAASEGLGIPLVMAAGGYAETLSSTIGDRTWASAHGYVHQRETLKRSRLLVTHGGANSVMEAVTAGVPMLVCPLANDQPIQAAFVEATGVGRALDLDAASVEEVRGALSRLLAVDAPERERARVMRVAYARRDGAREAAAGIVRVAQRGWEYR